MHGTYPHMRRTMRATSCEHYIYSGQWSHTFRIRNAIKIVFYLYLLLSAPHASQAINNWHTVSFDELCTTNHITQRTSTHARTRPCLTINNKRSCQFGSILLPNEKFPISKTRNVCWFRETMTFTQCAARQSTTFSTNVSTKKNGVDNRQMFAPIEKKKQKRNIVRS